MREQELICMHTWPTIENVEHAIIIFFMIGMSYVAYKYISLREQDKKIFDKSKIKYHDGDNT